MARFGVAHWVHPHFRIGGAGGNRTVNVRGKQNRTRSLTSPQTSRGKQGAGGPLGIAEYRGRGAGVQVTIRAAGPAPDLTPRCRLHERGRRVLPRALRDRRLLSTRVPRVGRGLLRDGHRLSSRTGHGELLRDGHLLSPRIVDELPVRIFGGAFEFPVREAEIRDFLGTILRKAVDAHDSAVRRFYQPPFAFSGQRVDVELSQVALGAWLARVFQQVLERPGKLPRPVEVVSLDRAPVLVARIEQLRFPVPRERGTPDLSGEGEAQAH